MSVWLVRAGKFGEDESLALEKGWAVVGWQEMPDISGIGSYEEMKQEHTAIYPDMSPKAVINNAAQLWTFLHRIQPGDMVALPLKTRSAIALGTVLGPYEYTEGRHLRRVNWVRDDIPRSSIGQDLLYSLGAFMTVCAIERNDAAKRLQAVMDGKPDPHLVGKPADLKTVPDNNAVIEDASWVDLEEQSLDQLRKLIESKFKGHGLARLVEAILNAKGYTTHLSPEGPDGGVDILAGRGPMGFDDPRICVQVKSGGVQNDSSLRELEGVMNRLHVETGLFVSWDGFNKTARQNVRDLFFRVRLWDDKVVIKNLLEVYADLPGEIQAELPLKRIWVVVPEGE